MIATRLTLAADAILATVRRNANLNYIQLEDDLARGDINGWLRLAAIRACNFSEWSGAMQMAIDALRADGARAEHDAADADAMKYAAP